MQNQLSNYTLTQRMSFCLAGAIVSLAAFIGFIEKENIQGLMDGTLQRKLETNFEDVLPFKKVSAQLWNSVRFLGFGEANSGALIGKGQTIFTVEEFTFPLDAPTFLGEIEKANRTLSSHGTKLVPFIVPDKARVLSEDHSFKIAPEIQNRYAAISIVFDELGIDTVNLFTLLDTDAIQSFFLTDTHWTPEAAKLVADELAYKFGPSNKSKANFETKLIGSTQLESDLVKFRDTGPFVEQIKEQVNLYETSGTAQEDLFGSSSVDIVLVGTSFSAREDFHFEGFLKTAFGQDVLNLSEEGQGPFAPMQKFLNGQYLTTNPPKLVLWEIPERYVDPRRLK